MNWKKAAAIASIVIPCLLLAGTVLSYVRTHELKLQTVTVEQEGIKEDVREIKRKVDKILDVLLGGRGYGRHIEKTK